MYTAPPLPAIAERLRNARLAANKTQQELAGDHYSKAYISAIECGKMTPSVQALHFLAERLDLPASYFLGEGEKDLQVLGAGPAAVGLRSIRESYQREEALLVLAEVEGHLRLNQTEEALQLLQVPSGPPSELPRLEQPRWYWLAGWALQNAERATEAIALLIRGLALAEEAAQQAMSPEHLTLDKLAEQLRCLLGTCEAAIGRMDEALERHQQGWAAAQAGQITDPTLQLQLALALGQDYLALGRYQEAEALYNETKPLLQASEDMGLQAQNAWERTQAHKAHGQVLLARHALQQALAIWALLDTQQERAGVQARIGKALFHTRNYTQTEQALQQSLALAERVGDTQTQGEVLHTLAQLYLKQGNPTQAITTAQEGVQIAVQHSHRRTLGQLSLTLAAAYEECGQVTEAEVTYQEALEQMIHSTLQSEAYECYAQFLQRQQRYEEAFQHMRRALTH